MQVYVKECCFFVKRQDIESAAIGSTHINIKLLIMTNFNVIRFAKNPN